MDKEVGVRERFRCRDVDLFVGSQVAQPVSIAPAEDDTWKWLNHFIIEFVASVVLTVSSVYVPEEGNDYMKQYVSSIAILAVMLTVKDKAYFCPDGTPMTTVVLAMSGAYTNIDKHTDKYDIGVRIIGQVAGWAVVCFYLVGTNKELFAYGLPGLNHRIGTSAVFVGVGEFVVVFNEFIATFIECVAISFMVMPLLKSYAPASGVDGFQSKGEAMPPKNKDLCFAAVSLAILHYVLERLFRTTMNPLAYIMHRYSTSFDNPALVAAVVAVQLLALSLASLYCFYLLPSPRVFEYLRAGK